MTLKSLLLASVLATTAIGITMSAAATRPHGNTSESQPSESSDVEKDQSLVTVDEARGRAELLHEALHATLQVVHREFYREDEGLPLPASTMEMVFEHMAEEKGVGLRWLAVNATAMSTTHEPKNTFEEEAIKALKTGAKSYERVENNTYRRCGPITLFSQCLKCHLPLRTSTKPRLAGLIISIPVRGE